MNCEDILPATEPRKAHGKSHHNLSYWNDSQTSEKSIS